MPHTTTRTTKPSLMTRLRGNPKPATTTTTTTKTVKTTRNSRHNNHHAGTAATTAPHHHHQRRPSFGDKVSGTIMKLKGSLLRKPGLKAAGARRERGTDGRGSHRAY